MRCNCVDHPTVYSPVWCTNGGTFNRFSTRHQDEDKNKINKEIDGSKTSALSTLSVTLQPKKSQVLPVAAAVHATWAHVTGKLHWVPSLYPIVFSFLPKGCRYFKALYFLFLFLDFFFLSFQLYLTISASKSNLNRETSFSFRFVAAQHVPSVFNFLSTDKTLALTHPALFVLDLWRRTERSFSHQISDL